MARPKRIVIVDKSELAGNLFRLLFASCDATLVVYKKFDDAVNNSLKRDGVDLAIFNSNAIGKFTDDWAAALNGPPLESLKKIFICREAPVDAVWRAKLGGVSNSAVVIRPFHPDELLKMAKGLAGIR